MSMFTLIAAEESLGTIEGLGGYSPGVGIEGATGSLTSLISNVIGFLTIVAGIAFLIYFTIGGLTWLIAGGDKGKVEAAQSRMTGGAIGMIIIVSAWAISWIIGQVLGVNFLNPVETLKDLGPKTVVEDDYSDFTNPDFPGNPGGGGKTPSEAM